MVTLSEKRLEDLATLSVAFNTILGMIQDGKAWLLWAINTSQHWVAEDEDELLELVQQGLHMDPYLRFNSFRAVVNRVTEFDDDDINTLAYAQHTEHDCDDVLSEVMAKYSLVSYTELTKVQDYLSSNAEADNVPFQAMSFSDQLRLYNLFTNHPDASTKMKAEAMEFAQSNACTVAEFIDFYWFYIIASKQLPSNTQVAVRQSEVRGYYKQLLPLCNYLIYTPNIGQLSTSKLQQQLRQFVKDAKFIGYPTKAAAMHNLALNMPLQNLESGNTTGNIERYLQGAQSQIVDSDTPPATLSQDGRVRTFRIPAAQYQLVVNVDAAGDVSLGASTIRTSK